MKIVSTEEMRALDHRTIEEFGVPGEELMDRAGFHIAEQVDRLAACWFDSSCTIQCLAGRGNNGGDALVAARYLRDRKYNVEVCLAGNVSDLRGDALQHWRRLSELDVPFYEWATLADWEGAQQSFPPGDILVDGLLGTGTAGPPRGPIAGGIAYINACLDRVRVVAIDAPSGLDPDSGAVPGAAVQADITVALGLPKRGLVQPSAAAYVGHLTVADIGFPREYIAELTGTPGVEVIHRTDLKPFFPRRDRHAHKGTYGHVLILGGSRAYPGAAALSVQGALRAGAGLVTAAVPASVVPIVAGLAGPEAIVRGQPETTDGSLAATAWDGWSEHASAFGALVVGPGLTPHADSLCLVERVLQDSRCPVVLDADALRVLVGHTDWLRASGTPLICTPHPGEFAALTNCSVEAVQSDRVDAARTAAREWGVWVVLKGCSTVVATPDGRAHINLTGNPGMATGGTGDVLAGVIGALLAQGQTPLNAARAGVYVHGAAGDLATAGCPEIGLIASDVVGHLGFAFQSLCLR